MLQSRWIAIGLASLMAASAFSQTEGLLLKRATELRQGPSAGTAAVAALAAQTPVTRLPERQGPWMHVKTDAGQTGWIHMFDVGTATTSSSAGGTATGALRGLSNFFNRSSTSTAVTTSTSTVGIRGMGAEDIANAQPNLVAIKQTEGLRADAAQARKFAAEAQWAARVVEPLPAPQPAVAAEAEVGGGAKRGGSK